MFSCRLEGSLSPAFGPAMISVFRMTGTKTAPAGATNTDKGLTLMPCIERNRAMKTVIQSLPVGKALPQICVAMGKTPASHARLRGRR